MLSTEWKPEYDTLLSQIAKTCTFDQSWKTIKELIKYKLHQNISNGMDLLSTETPQSTETLQMVETKIFEALDIFEEAPFTIQRLCELVQDPGHHHKNVWKYLRAVLKTVHVTSPASDFVPNDAFIPLAIRKVDELETQAIRPLDAMETDD